MLLFISGRQQAEQEGRWQAADAPLPHGNMAHLASLTAAHLCGQPGHQEGTDAVDNKVQHCRSGVCGVGVHAPRQPQLCGQDASQQGSQGGEDGQPVRDGRVSAEGAERVAWVLAEEGAQARG